MWRDGRHIAQIEMAAIVNALIYNLHMCHGRQVILFTDNKVAEAALIKNASGNDDVDRMAHWAHLTPLRNHVDLWVEFVESELNWADAPSRGNFMWAKARGWDVKGFTILGWESLEAAAQTDASVNEANMDHRRPPAPKWIPVNHRHELIEVKIKEQCFQTMVGG